MSTQSMASAYTKIPTAGHDQAAEGALAEMMPLSALERMLYTRRSPDFSLVSHSSMTWNNPRISLFMLSAWPVIRVCTGGTL